jgi:hypothetical protein
MKLDSDLIQIGSTIVMLSIINLVCIIRLKYFGITKDKFMVGLIAFTIISGIIVYLTIYRKP